MYVLTIIKKIQHHTPHPHPPLTLYLYKLEKENKAHQRIFLPNINNFKLIKFVHSYSLIISYFCRFMSTGDSLLPGNLGMKDQVLALKWIKQNIRAFGGNPDEVTISGQSSGGSAVHYHLLSPLSKGLFKRAIAQSGSALSPWAFTTNATDRTLRYASYLGFIGETTSELMEFLMTVDAKEFVKARGPALDPKDRKNALICVWAPHVEPENEGAFLTEHPAKLISENRYTHVPYLTGVTSYELLVRTQEKHNISCLPKSFLNFMNTCDNNEITITYINSNGHLSFTTDLAIVSGILFTVLSNTYLEQYAFTKLNKKYNEKCILCRDLDSFVQSTDVNMKEDLDIKAVNVTGMNFL
ncbi:venom carboxylesterase-6-like [Schistocerca piceifrons]|uniref:venom carboxylesterase-6-like n=1 Tax=Schistocerca piceifrons TaxID=274613 RepID=UPI001F5FA13B|nr:venom carboxylesterase-6-like [Schistocerca piceifrons]